MSVGAHVREETDGVTLEELSSDLLGLEQQQEHNQHFEEIDRLESLGYGVEDLIELTTGIESATPREVQLIHTATELALSGSDISVEELIPSLEDSVGSVIATESLKATANSIWEAIRRTVKRIWQLINDFFDGTKGDIMRLRLRIKQVRHRGQNMTGRTIKTSEVTLGREINALSTYHRKPRDAKDVVEGLNEILNQCKMIFGGYSNAVEVSGRKLKNTISQFDTQNPEKSLRQVVEAGQRFDPRKEVGSLTAVMDSRWEKNTVQRLPPLMGNKSIFFMQPRARGGSNTLLAEAEATRNRRTFMAMSSPEAINAHTEGEVKTFPAASVLEITNLVESIVELISGYQSRLASLDKTHRDIQSSSQVLAGVLSTRDSISEPVRAHVRAALNFNTSYTQWCNQPQMSLMALALTACRAALIASGKSLSNH